MTSTTAYYAMKRIESFNRLNDSRFGRFVQSIVDHYAARMHEYNTTPVADRPPLDVFDRVWNRYRRARVVADRLAKRPTRHKPGQRWHKLYTIAGDCMCQRRNG